MATKPTRPTAPPQALRSDPATFSANAEASIAYQWTVLPDWIEGMGDFVDARADEALAAALGGDLPPLTGKALNMIRVNSGATAVEFRTPAQVLSDLGVTATAAEINLIDGAVDHSTAAWQAGSATQVGLPSPADVAAAIAAQVVIPEGLGQGQTWQSVARSGSVTYTNTTGKPIQVNVASGTASGANADATLTATVGGVSFVFAKSVSGADNVFDFTATAGNFIVPTGATYSVSSNCGISSWHELR